MGRLNLTGKTFGRLYVKDFAYTLNGRTFWTCICECDQNKEVVVKGKYLTNGDTSSCGCLNIERVRQMGLDNKKYNEYYAIDNVVHVKFANCDGEFLCDLNDWENAKEICWFKENTGYARGELNGQAMLFHDYIFDINASPNIEIDHIDGNRLDNRRSNLRICTRSKNALNKGLMRNNTSGVTGVSWHKQHQKWYAYIQIDHKRIYLGLFDNFDSAVKARLNAEKQYFKEFSRNAKVVK